MKVTFEINDAEVRAVVLKYLAMGDTEIEETVSMAQVAVASPTPPDPRPGTAAKLLNDPTQPALDADRINEVFIRKGFDPIPNVRAVGEMDDRVGVLEAELEFFVTGQSKPIRYFRAGPLWLGLVCGLRFEMPRVDDGS